MMPFFIKLKDILLFFWNHLYNIGITFVDCVYFSRDYFVKNCFVAPNVLSVKDTIQKIFESGLSVARYGDGEIKLCKDINLSFQKADTALCTRLRNILANNEDGLLVCVPGVFGDLDIYMEHDRKHWTKHLAYYRRVWYKYMDRDKQYGEAFISRFYMPYKDKSVAFQAVGLWKQVWADRDLLIVEGEKSRLGVGNDLFDNARSIKRILAPNKEAYSYYDRLITEIKKYDSSHMVLLALGPTATVMAADLCKLGFQAIDIGHIDIEYEWMKMNADHKVPINNKFVNEAGGYNGDEYYQNQDYESQIVCRF